MQRHRIALAALLLTASAWGATFTLIKHILTKIAPEPFIFWRFTLAGVILVAFAAARKRLSRPDIRPGIILGMFVFVGYWAQTRGLLYISPSRSALLTGLCVVLVPFADRLIFRRRIPLQAWVGSVLAVIGTAVLIGGFDARPNLGDVLTIFCAIVFALHIAYAADWSSRHSPLGLAGVQILVVGLAAAPFVPFAPPTPARTDVIVVIIVTAVVTTALAFAILMWAQSLVSATEAAVILAFEPVAASITSIVWDKEPITSSFVIGALLILVAMIVTQVKLGLRTED